MKSVQEVMISLDRLKERSATLQPLVEGNFIKKILARKIAASGLSFIHLQAAFVRMTPGLVGLRNLLSKKFQGKVCVSKSATIIESIAAYIESTLENEE